MSSLPSSSADSSENPTITVERFQQMRLSEHPSGRTASPSLGANASLMPTISPLQPSHTGSSITSAISTDSLADNSVPEAEEIKDGHTIQLEPKPFASGGYADVHRGTWTPASGGRPGSPAGPIQVAVKILRVSGLAEDMTTDYGKQLSRMDKHLAREMHTWQKLHHKRITPLFGYMGSKNTVISGERPLLVSPYYRNKNLRIYLHNNPNADVLALLYQAAEGLEYLHSRRPFPIAHLDIKAENILITDEDEASICDFGVARVLDNISTGWTTSSPAFTAVFASPEVLRGDNGQTSADVYSFSSLILEALSGRFPWYKFKNNLFKIMQLAESGTTPIPEDHPIPSLSAPALVVLWELLHNCWKKEPTERPTMGQVMIQLQEVRKLARGE
ncbi:hypothetical protein FRB94_014115 [Tulasnella sp. JGI-2019a]|nr:hypothetical protein FRB93_011259 [Tulasnella sp. JGI-2019a]KAG8989712.1 hypothetical protein FRB94_014115 [Tulasnella sp. JGI-2019a]KAG9024709.1 hypothetical protein FRB95_011162 [Tulasnella sp. JGI-2019a]